MKSVLLVEDDPNLGFVIQENLTKKGYTVSLARDGEQGWQQFEKEVFNICILDVMLPRMDGFALARAIRQRNADIPILFLTARSLPEDKLEGFSTGADDYIVKPFNMDELVYRMEVFLRRVSGAGLNGSSFALGQFIFDYANLTLSNSDSQIKLTSREAEVLRLLCANRNRVLKREEILKSVWGDDDYFLGRSLDVFISKLRKYLKEDPGIQIQNYHGVGFKLEIAEATRE